VSATHARSIERSRAAALISGCWGAHRPAPAAFWVPPDARWESTQSRAKLPWIGTDIDHAMDLSQKENPILRGVLPRT